MTITCKVDECDRVADGSRGWCRAHYMRWWTTKEEPSGPIAPPQRKTPEPCIVDGCTLNARVGDMCSPHGRRAQRNDGDPGPAEIETKRGHNRGRDRWMAGNGYWWVRQPGHPNAYKNGTVQEHTVVMSEILGRPLVKGENVHHKNGVRSDNRPENLELWVNHQPKGARVTDLLVWARELIERYGDVPPESLG